MNDNGALVVWSSLSLSLFTFLAPLSNYKTPQFPLFSLHFPLHLLSMDQFRTKNGFNLEDDDLAGDLPVAGDDRRKRPASGGGNGGKRGGNGTGGVAPPSCQADACPAVLTDAKRYHRRHKVCEFHAKASVVTVAGLRQRFCQQCSRFHELTEFDEAKRSCRRRLAGHNERRRKGSSSETIGASSSTSSQCRDSTDEKNRGGITLLPSAGNSATSAAYKHFQIG